MTEFLSSPFVQIFIFFTGVTGWLVGIYSAIIQRKSYNKQIDSEKAYEEILENAKIEWKGKYTKEQVEILKTELISLENKVNTIKKDVPIKAKEVFLTDQLISLDSSLVEAYKQRAKVLGEIEVLRTKSDEISITSDIKKEIESLVEPLYHKKREQEKRTRYLLFSILGIVIISALPFLIQLLSLRIKQDNYDFGIPIYSIVIVLGTYALGIYLGFNSRLIKEKHLLWLRIWSTIPLLLFVSLAFLGSVIVVSIFIDTIDFERVNYYWGAIVFGLIISLMSSFLLGLSIYIGKEMNRLKI